MCAHERLVRARRWGHGSSVVVVLLFLKPFALSKPYTRKPTIKPEAPSSQGARFITFSSGGSCSSTPLYWRLFRAASFLSLEFWGFGVHGLGCRLPICHDGVISKQNSRTSMVILAEVSAPSTSHSKEELLTAGPCWTWHQSSQ